MIKKKLLVTLAVILGGVCLGGLSVFADDTDGTKSTMTISPPEQRIVLVPGEVYEGSISVSSPHNAGQDLDYSVTVGSFNFGKGEDGRTDYSFTDVDSITQYNEMMEWIELGKDHGSVAPNSTEVIPFTITVPENAPAGGQYATIIVQNDTEDNTSGDGNVAIQSVVRFAAKIIAEVAGTTEEKGSILENSIPAFMFNSPLSATSVVKNEGNVHTDAEYTLQVWPLFSGEEICTNEENPTKAFLAPDTERLHVEDWCNLPAIGIFRAKQTVRIFNEESVLEKVVFICPLWLLFIIIFAIVALVIWAVMKSRARKGRSKEQKKSSEE